MRPIFTEDSSQGTATPQSGRESQPESPIQSKSPTPAVVSSTSVNKVLPFPIGSSDQVPATHRTIRSGSIFSSVTDSSSDVSSSPTLSPSSDEATSSLSSEPLTQTTLLVAWKSMLHQLDTSGHHGLSSRLSGLEPTLLSDGKIELMAANQNTEKFLTEQLSFLSTSLCKFLHPHIVTLIVRLSESSGPSRILSQSEQYSKMLELSEPLRRLQETLQLSL